MEIDNFSIRPFFSHVFGLDHHYADGKLDRGKQLVEKIDIPSEKILLIGDTLHDLHVADKLGIKSLLIAQGHHSFERLIAESEYVFRSFPELIEKMETNCR